VGVLSIEVVEALRKFALNKEVVEALLLKSSMVKLDFIEESGH